MPKCDTQLYTASSFVVMKIKLITDEKSIERYGGARMCFAPPIDHDRVMEQIPQGKVTTVGAIREFFAKQAQADFTDPITAGIFVSIAAWASHQRAYDITPCWRTLKTDGELNPKYPGSIDAQRTKLEEEGHTIIERGRKRLRSYVQDYENALLDMTSDSIQ